MPNMDRDGAISYLKQKSCLYASLIIADIADTVILVDTTDKGQNAIAAKLRAAFGRDIEVRNAKSIMRAQNMFLDGMPSLLVLTDRLPVNEGVELNLHKIRDVGYVGKIILLCERVEIWMNKEMHPGVGFLSHDELNSINLIEALLSTISCGNLASRPLC